MAITLKDVKQASVAGMAVQKVFLDTFKVAEVLPLETNGSLTAKWAEEGSLPTVQNRALNAVFTDMGSGHDTEHQADVPIYGGLLQIDHQLLSEPGGDKTWASQKKKATKAMAYKLANDFLLGDPATSPTAMTGLKAWASTLPSRQVVDLSSLDLSTDANREANARTIVRRMHEAIITMEDGVGDPPDLILMNVTLYSYLSDAMRVSGFLNTGKDAQNYGFDTFMGVRIMRMGYGAPTGMGQSTQPELLSNNHDSTGVTSMYFLKKGMDYCHLLQKHDLRVTDLGGSERAGTADTNGTFIKSLVEWPVMFICPNSNGLYRLSGIKVA